MKKHMYQAKQIKSIKKQRILTKEKLFMTD